MSRKIVVIVRDSRTPCRIGLDQQLDKMTIRSDNGCWDRMAIGAMGKPACPRVRNRNVEHDGAVFRWDPWFLGKLGLPLRRRADRGLPTVSTH